MRILLFCYLFIALVISVPLETRAQDEEANIKAREVHEAILAAHGKDVHRIEEYLSAISTITADFMQVAPDGSLAAGKFFLMRPGRMRWQYDPPTPVLMVSNGQYLIYYDYELQQVSHISLDDTLIGFLARPEIHFDGTVSIERFEARGGSLRVTVFQTTRPSDGKLMLEFSDKPLQLRSFVVTDAQGQITTVSLANARFDIPLEAELFEFKDPRKLRNR